MSAFLLKDQKKSLAKEKSPAGEKLPEIHAQWRQELQHVLLFLFFDRFVTGNSCLSPLL